MDAVIKSWTFLSDWYFYPYLILFGLYVLRQHLRLRRSWKQYFEKQSTYTLSAESVTRAVHMGLISASILIPGVSGLALYYARIVSPERASSMFPLLGVVAFLLIYMTLAVRLAYRAVTMEEQGKIEITSSRLNLMCYLSAHFLFLIWGAILLGLFLLFNSPTLLRAEQPPQGSRLRFEEILGQYASAFRQPLVPNESPDDVRTEARIIMEERTKNQKRDPTPEDAEIALFAISQVGGPPEKTTGYVQKMRSIRMQFTGISNDTAKQEEFRKNITADLKSISRTGLNRLGTVNDPSLFFK